MPIDIYLNIMSSSSKAVLMTARHLKIDLNFKTVDLLEGEHLKPDFLKLNPAHCLPTIVDNGFILWESRAIMAYLCNQYAPDSTLYPKEPKKRAIVDRWLIWDMAFYECVHDAIMFKIVTGEDLPEDKVMAIKNKCKLLDQLIGDNKYLVDNELTIADLSVLAGTTMLELIKFEGLAEFPRLMRWMATLQKELPYYEEVYTSPEELQDRLIKIKAALKKMNK